MFILIKTTVMLNGEIGSDIVTTEAIKRNITQKELETLFYNNKETENILDKIWNMDNNLGEVLTEICNSPFRNYCEYDEDCKKFTKYELLVI